MAKNNNNIITHGMSGMLGGQIVFKQFKDGRSIASVPPKDSNVPPSQKQLKVRERFQEAIVYGKAVYADPAVKDAYANAAGPGQSAYNVAIADFFNGPDINEIDVSRYAGKIGDTITVRVTDDFKVKSVQVKIENEDASLVEEGNAVLGVNGLDWVFTAAAVNSTLTGDKITITAKDTPDNKTLKETKLD